MGPHHAGWGVTRIARTNDACGHTDRPHYAKGLCRACYRTTPEFAAKRHAYYVANKEQFREHTRKSRARGTTAQRLYGLLPVTYRRMVEAQGGLCAICQRPPGKKRLGVDHNHATGRVRALLCARCNTAIGALRDDPDICRRAADYLTLWRS